MAYQCARMTSFAGCNLWVKSDRFPSRHDFSRGCVSVCGEAAYRQATRLVKLPLGGAWGTKRKNECPSAPVKDLHPVEVRVYANDVPLRKKFGRKGALGLVIGLCCKRPYDVPTGVERGERVEGEDWGWYRR